MKSYRLKKWYPSLYKDWIVGDIVIPWEEQKDYYHVPNKNTTIHKEEVENNPDFWELIEKQEPLFITEDGVECFDGDGYISIGNDFSKINMLAYNCDAPYLSDVIRFKHKYNADQYIWRNKPLFSYVDFIRWGNVPYERVIEQLAKERIDGYGKITVSFQYDRDVI